MAKDWEPPFPFGYQAAIESAGSVAAPLLGGFSFALVGLIVPAPEHFRWPSIALVFLLAGGITFIAAVQCSFWTRQYAISPEDIELWRRDYPDERKVALQRLHRLGFAIWARRFNSLYRLAIVFLLAGVTFALIPPGHIGGGRYVAIAVAAAGLAGELLWILAGMLLVGSPTAIYEDQVDEPRSDAGPVRRSPILRRVARSFIPVIRADRGLHFRDERANRPVDRPAGTSD